MMILRTVINQLDVCSLNQNRESGTEINGLTNMCPAWGKQEVHEDLYHSTGMHTYDL